MTTSTASLTPQGTPNDLDAYWMPFTANRSFKANPRMVARAEGVYYYTPEGRPINPSSGLMSLPVMTFFFSTTPTMVPTKSYSPSG